MSSFRNTPIQHNYCQFISKGEDSRNDTKLLAVQNPHNRTGNCEVIDLVDSSDDLNSDVSSVLSHDDLVDENTRLGGSKKAIDFVNLMDSSSDSDEQQYRNRIRPKTKIKKKLTKRRKNAASNKTLSASDITKTTVQEPRIYICSSSSDEDDGWNDGWTDSAENGFESPTNFSVTTTSEVDSSDEDERQLRELINDTKRLTIVSEKDSDNKRSHNDGSNKKNDNKVRKPKSSSKPRTTLAKENSRHSINHRTPKKKKDFQKHRDFLTLKIFRDYNQRAFDGKLSSVKVVWSNKLRTTAGLTRLKRISKLGGTPEERLATIELSQKVLDDEDRLCSTLLHEMVHCAAWIIDGVSKPPHGSCFKKWARIAMKKIPGMIVTTTHDYAIQFKYAWACTKDGCNFIVKRHSRSVDISRQCCGLCKGRLVDIEVPNDEQGTKTIEKPLKPTPRKRAPLSAYNLFIKEHSTEIREKLMKEQMVQGIQNPRVSQALVLKECALMWRVKKQADEVSRT